MILYSLVLVWGARGSPRLRVSDKKRLPSTGTPAQGQKTYQARRSRRLQIRQKHLYTPCTREPSATSIFTTKGLEKLRAISS